ncbi:MAG: hypothetical protein AVDCRST_MAG19-4889 [uncultured Thermomicrobiales bacterium]|uniref:TNase-like domain-containing protein n=1 Tax=uncultured Thermomicrobiales bacterium TaxID=1645740 RepID=A0A6J4VVT2_9BACT|nr:MAG: hypothetical protein AVDCRST_MAG19-4889 [uncultured Thermomicrobiales bacterium]
MTVNVEYVGEPGQPFTESQVIDGIDVDRSCLATYPTLVPIRDHLGRHADIEASSGPTARAPASRSSGSCGPSAATRRSWRHRKAGMATRKPKERQRCPTALRVAIDFGTLPASVRYAVDGDTFGALVDRGGATYVFETIRLAAIQCDELDGDDPNAAGRARAAKAFLEDLLPEGRQVLIAGQGMDDHDRIVAFATIETGGTVDDVGSVLLAAGHARLWTK